MTTHEFVEWFSRRIVDETQDRNQLDSNIERTILTLGDEVRARTRELYERENAAEPTEMLRRECGRPCEIDEETQTSHHLDPDCPTGIDHDADADHVAIPEEE